MTDEKKRYYKVDMGYDKLVYETTPVQFLVQCAVFSAFYTFHGFVLWGLFEFGMWKSNDYTIFAICIFLFALIVLAVMIITGSYSNEKKHLETFLKLKVSEMKQKKEEE